MIVFNGPVRRLRTGSAIIDLAGRKRLPAIWATGSAWSMAA